MDSLSTLVLTFLLKLNLCNAVRPNAGLYVDLVEVWIAQEARELSLGSRSETDDRLS